jgi:hypothetical protein
MNMNRFRAHFVTAVIAVFAFTALPHLHAEDFKPVNPAELAMKDNPANPGAHAMILEWTDSEDDNSAYSDHYFRMKIFTEEGKKYGDVEIPYFKNAFSISNIKARVIKPDGSITMFTGKVFDKMVVKYKGYKYQAKTFSLPDVQPGCLIEYRYRTSWEQYTLYNTHWELQRDLFVKKASFKLSAYSGAGGFASRFMAIGLPPGRKVDQKGSTISLELENIPAFDEERYSPPERELKPRVEFFYTDHDDATPQKFWERMGKSWTDETESFIGNNRKSVLSAWVGLNASADAPEAKLHKIYEYVQKLRNASFEREKTEQEAKRDKTKDDKNADDVVKNGYGYHNDLNLLFAAMVRAAGMEAFPAYVSKRDEYFFNQNLPDSQQLDAMVVMVKAAGKEMWFDPGTPFTPFGLLRWQRAGVQGMLLQKNNNIFIHTPNADSKDAVTKRLITIKQTDVGFKADVAIAYYGYEALEKRLDQLEDDEAEIRQGLEDEMKESLPGGSTVKLTGIENTKDSDKPFMVSFDVTLPDFSSGVGSRRLVPLAILEMGDRNPFQHEGRKFPVYYHYPYQEIDRITFELPDGMRIESVPDARFQQPLFGYYSTTWEKKDKAVVMNRSFAVLGVFFKTDYYSELRDFYSKVATGDQDNVVLRAQTSAGK